MTNIKDRISVITWDKNIVSKHQHLDTIQAKNEIMTHQVNLFIDMFNPLFKKGLPLFGEEKGGMFSQNEYHDWLISCRLDHKNLMICNNVYLERP